MSTFCLHAALAVDPGMPGCDVLPPRCTVVALSLLKGAQHRMPATSTSLGNLGIQSPPVYMAANPPVFSILLLFLCILMSLEQSHGSHASELKGFISYCSSLHPSLTLPPLSSLHQSLTLSPFSPHLSLTLPPLSSPHPSLALPLLCHAVVVSMKERA